MNYQNQIVCPKCGSNQLSANKKGFSGQKAVAGAVLTGGIGLLAGTIGSNKIKITCLACGHVFSPGQGVTGSHPAPVAKKTVNENSTGGLIITFIIIAFVIFLISKC